MLRAIWLAPLTLVPLIATSAAAQVERELLARSRMFAEVGPGVRALKRDAAGRYCMLTAPGGAVAIYNAAGQRVTQVPATDPKEALVFGDDLDIDSAGRIYVADRGGNAIKVFNADGTPALTIPIPAPTSVVALADGEIAVASMKSTRLVTVFDARGKLVREFGELSEVADRGEVNRFLNIGRLATDPASHIYYAFHYLPEPTLRKYDRFGYAALEIELTTLEFQPAAQAARREIQRQERGGTPAFKPIVTAIAVDPATEEIWVALGGLLLHFDRDGNRRGTYRTFRPEGARLEAVAILVEPQRLLLAADPLGVYEFARPDKTCP